MKDLTLDLVEQKILHLESDQEFTLKKLYLLSEWRSYTKASRLSVGRRFYNAISNKTLLKDSVEFMGKDFDNAAMYKKLWNIN